MSDQSGWSCRPVDRLDSAGWDRVDQEGLLRFQHFVPFSTEPTQLFLLECYNPSGRLAGVAPVVRLVRRSSSDTLRRELRRWLAPVLRLVSRKTTYLIDTSFTAFAPRSPFYSVDPDDRDSVRRAVVDWMQQRGDCDAIWIAEPDSDVPAGSPIADWYRGNSFYGFEILPMVSITWPAGATLAEHEASLSRKRRRNLRVDRQRFRQGSGRFELATSPFPDPLLDAMQCCLYSSEQAGSVHVPFNDVMIGPAFRTQPQTAWLAWVDNTLAGFISFVTSGDRLMQCHGGFDYRVSLPVRAYPNLIHRAVEHAISDGLAGLGLGPLNNEAKRRAGTSFDRMRAYLWNRRKLDRRIVRQYFAKNFESYVAE